MSFMNGIIRLGRFTNKLINHQVLGAKLREHQKKLFTKYLLLTNLGISISFSGFGDFLEQTYEIAAGYEDHWDKKRTFKMATTGVPVGFVLHHWYIFLDKFITARTAKFLVRKFLLDQFIGSPLYITTFFVWMSLWNGWSFEQFKTELFSKGGSVYQMEWFVYPPAQIINFYFLPTKFRLLYDSTISLGFDTYFSYLTHKDKREKKMVDKKEEGKPGEVVVVTVKAER